MRFRKVIDDSGKSKVHLDLEGIKLTGFKFDYVPFLDYRIDTYVALRHSSRCFSWNVVFKPVHDFLDTRPEEEQQAFASMLTLMHYEIADKLYTEDIQVFNSNLVGLETELSVWLADFDLKYDLVPHVHTWVEQNIPIQSFAGVGERPQDSDLMTFYREDVVELTTLVVICKLMTPITGIFIEACKKKIDNKLKEIHCLAIMKNLFQNRFSDLIHKLKYFIGRIMKPILNQDDPSYLFNGYTFSTAADEIYARLIVRQFVTVDLFKDNGNLVTYTTSCVRSATRTQFSPTQNQPAARDMHLPKEQLVAISDEGNSSNLEAESRSSNRTADYTMLITVGAERSMDSFITEWEISLDDVTEASYYYSINHITPSVINSFVLGLIFGNELNGAQSIEMLDATMYTKLISCIQIYFAKNGYPLLVHPLSLIDTNEFKLESTGADIQLQMAWNGSYEYKVNDERKGMVIGDLKWDTRLNEIKDYITRKKLVYNTAPCIINLLGEENHNGEQFFADIDYMRQMCSLILGL